MSRATPLAAATLLLLVLGLAPATATHGAGTDQLGRVEGAVKTAGGWSLAGREVTLQRLDGEPAGQQTARVDEANRFAFERVPPGVGYRAQLAGIDDGPAGPCSDPAPLSITAGETTPVLIACWR